MVLASIIAGCVPLLLFAGLLGRLGPSAGLGRAAVLPFIVLGVAFGLAADATEQAVFELTGLSLRVGPSGASSALLATFLFSAPLEEALKALPLWPLYRRHRITSPARGMCYALAIAAGFAAAETSRALLAEFNGISLLRAMLSLAAQLFFSGLCGYALGAGSMRGHWFSVAWLCAMLLHGVFDHVVFGHGPGFLVAALPLLLAMGLVSWSVLREVAPHSGPSSSRRSLVFAAPPSLHAVRQALRHPDRPLIVRWILLGALVTLGVMMVLFAFAIYAGRKLGVDFSVTNQGDVRSSGPLVLFGVAGLAAFPIAAFLVAKASGTNSLVEPALGSGVAITLTLLLISVTAPMGIIFALATAPAAFALAFVGAWIGLGRREHEP